MPLLLMIIMFFAAMPTAQAEVFDIIDNPSAYCVHFMKKGRSCHEWQHGGEDYGYFPDHPDIMITPGSRHHTGTSAVIVGRWRYPNGERYLILNSGVNSNPIPLRTRREFDSFINILVPRKPGLTICPLLDARNITCDIEPPTMTLQVWPTTMTRVPTTINYRWNTTRYENCQIRHYGSSGWESVAASGSGELIAGGGYVHRLRCTEIGTGKLEAVSRNVTYNAPHVHELPWMPEPKTRCKGDRYTQRAACGHTRPAIGTLKCGGPPPPPPPIDPCDASDVTRHHAYVQNKYRTVYKRNADPGGLCVWSMHKRDNPNDSGAEFLNSFLFGARSAPGDVCPGVGFPKGDCYRGEEYMKDNPGTFGSGSPLYTCRECLNF